MRLVFFGPHRVEARHDASGSDALAFTFVLPVAVANGRRLFHPRLMRDAARLVGGRLLIDARVDARSRPKSVRRVSLGCAQAIDFVDARSAGGAEAVG